MKQTVNTAKRLLLDKKLTLILMGGLIGLIAFFVIIMLGSFDLEELQNILSQFPEAFLEFLGGLEELSTPYGFLTMEFLGFIWLYAGIYLIYMSSNLLPQEIEEKTIELSLSKPITRKQFLGSKIVFLFTFILGMMGVSFLIVTGGVVTSPIFQAEGLYLERLWGTYLITVLFLGALAMIAVLFSTILLKSKKSMAFAIIVFFLMFFLGAFYTYLPAEAENAKYISIFFYYNPSEYMVHGNFNIFLRDLLVLGAINTGLIVSSLIIFNKKDIPI